MRTIELTIDGRKVCVRTRRGRTPGTEWWVADLRGAGFREISLGIEATEGSEGRAGAATAAWMQRLRAENVHADARPSPGTLEAAAAEWLRAVRFSTETTRGFYRKHIRVVSRELGDRTIGELAPPAGNRVLAGWRDAMRARGLSAHTANHRIGALRRLLVWCVEEGFLLALPRMPDPTIYDGEVIYTPTCEPISAALYDAVRAAMLPMWRARAARGDARAIDHLARRLLYLDFIRYTGAHPHDADTLVGAHVSPDVGVFLRRNLKNKSSVRPMWIRMPPPLAAAMRAEFARRGAIKPAELICGRWVHPTREIAVACEKLGVPSFTLLDLRSTVATELGAAGIEKDTTVSLLGHASSQMTDRVYEKIPTEQLSLGMDAIGRAAAPPPAPVVPITAELQTGDAEARKGPHAAAPSAPSASQARRKSATRKDGNHGK